MSVQKPRVFWLHYNRFGASRLAKDVWTVHMSDRCIPARTVECHVPITSVYKGDTAPQPRAYFRGKGIVRVCRKGLVTIR